MGGIEKEERTELIIKYMNLDHSVRRLQKSLDHVRSIFYDLSLHTRTEANGLEITVKAYRVENEVCKYVDSVQRSHLVLENRKKARKYFNDYLDSLSPKERDYLYQRYLMGYDLPEQEELDSATIEEISEIEDAICYMNGIQPDTLNRVADGTELNFDELLEALDI